jgi:hypothetical protein
MTTASPLSKKVATTNIPIGVVTKGLPESPNGGTISPSDIMSPVSSALYLRHKRPSHGAPAAPTTVEELPITIPFPKTLFAIKADYDFAAASDGGADGSSFNESNENDIMQQQQQQPTGALSMREGEILMVTDISNQNWWNAISFDSSSSMQTAGLIPSNYVSILPLFSSVGALAVEEAATTDDCLETLHVSEGDGEVNISFQIGSLSTLVSASALSRKSNKIVPVAKTIEEISIFAKELSRHFSEAGMPTDFSNNPSAHWIQLLQAHYAFIYRKTAGFAATFLANLMNFASLKPFLFG